MSKHTKVGDVFSGKEVISAAEGKKEWAGEVERGEVALNKEFDRSRQAVQFMAVSTGGEATGGS